MISETIPELPMHGDIVKIDGITKVYLVSSGVGEWVTIMHNVDLLDLFCETLNINNRELINGEYIDKDVQNEFMFSLSKLIKDIKDSFKDKIECDNFLKKLMDI